MKMHTLLLFSITWLVLIIADSIPCGPQGMCSCIPPHGMDCFSTNYTLLDICHSIRNETSRFWIVKLRAEKNNFQEIKNKDLDGCEQLTSLFLGKSNVSFHDNCTFCGLNKLEVLDLSFNNINLDNKTFNRKRQFPLSIRTLKLNGNSDKAISDNSCYPDLSYLKELGELYIDGLSSRIFPISYRNLTNLTKLVLTGLQGKCDIVEITNETLINLVNIRHLNLSACNISNVYAGAFEQLFELEVLDLSENRRMGLGMLRNISYGLQFTQIRSLNISKVQNTFGMSTQIRQRDVCYLWNTSITEIVVNSNRIEMLETNMPILLSKSLKILHMEDNKFTFGPYILQIGCVSQLTEFYGNYQNFAHSPHLYDLQPEEYTRDYDIQGAECPFMTTEFLRNVSKSNKYCHFFEPGQKINTKDNYPMFPEHIKQVHFATSGMEYNVSRLMILPLANNIEYLDFSGNILHGLTGPVGPYPNAKYLDLSKNYCSFISLNSFNGLINLETLQLHHNFIGLVFNEEIYGQHIFDKLTNLKSLNLSSNIISHIPSKVLSSLASLETIDLSVNNIEKWTIEVETLDNLLNLNLSTNFFQTLPKMLILKLVDNSARLNRSFSINLRNNVLKVSCDEKEFLELLVKYRRSFSFFEEYSFQDSSGLPISAEVFVKQVNGLDKICKSYILEIVLGSIGVSVCLAIIIGGFIYKNRWKIRYLMRLTKIRHFGYRRVRENQDSEDYGYDAFISYANENLQFILDQIVPGLETRGLNLCLHDRDFVPGQNIADNIINAVRNSRTTVIVLSTDFLKSEWCLYEFNMARMESIYSRAGSNCLLVIMYEEVSDRDMPNEMLEWIRSNTYLEFTTEEQGLELFWDNLYEALRG